MTGIDPLVTIRSPIFPPEKDYDVPIDYTPLAHSGSLQVFIKLAEPAIFLRGFESSNAKQSSSSSILRGSLIIRVLKPTRLKSIKLALKGYCRTEWPEGIPPKRNEFVEINDVVNHTWTFYQSNHFKYIPVLTTTTKTNNNKSNHNHNSNVHVDYLLKNSSAAMYQPLPRNGSHSSINTTTGVSSTINTLHGFSLSPVSSRINIPSPSTGTFSIASNTAATNKDTRHPRKMDISPKGGSIRSLSPLSLFRRTSIHTDTPNKQTTNRSNPHISQNSNNSTRMKTSYIDNKLNSPVSTNSLLTDLFGNSTTNNSTSQLNNLTIPTSAIHRRLSNASTLRNKNKSHPNSPSMNSIDTTTPSSTSYTTTLTNSNSNGIASDITSLESIPQSVTIKETQFIKSTEPHDSFTFEPGDYIYTFERVIPQNYPESITADYGFAEYFLLVTVERSGAFKTNLHAKLPVTIVRTPSDNSVEESEPIVISKDWEGRLFYDILVSSKDIILDAFLPIHFSLFPSDKVTLHRIRVYVTETMEYYCKNRKIRRMEPTKKFLLAELNGPKLPNAPDDGKPLKAKYMGNLLEENGYLVNRDFELQVFIPSRFGNSQYLHPDTGFEYIKSNHWIKICLRLSQILDNKTKHYEISIDSPIHVLNKLCSHANILLPSYDSHYLANTVANNNDKNGSDPIESFYHDSNIFFPKEIMMSPLVSPDVKPLDINLNSPPTSPLPRSTKTMTVNNNGIVISNNKSKIKSYQDGKCIPSADAEIFKSPKLSFNIYQPESLQKELTYPQAIPLSPILSPRILPKTLVVDDIISFHSVAHDDLPPSFNSIYKNSKEGIHKMPSNPPTYEEALKSKRTNITDYNNKLTINQRNNVQNIQRIPKIILNRSQESLLSKPEIKANIDDELEGCSIYNENDTDVSDIASGFSFQESLHHNFPSISSKTKNLDVSGFHRRNSIHDNLPSTVKTNNTLFTDLNQVLGDMQNEGVKAHSPNLPNSQKLVNPDNQSPRSIASTVQDISTALEMDSNDTSLRPSVSTDSSQGNLSARSSFDTSRFSVAANTSAIEPLLHPVRSHHTANRSFDDSFIQSFDSINDYAEEPIINSSVDLTTLFDRNSVGWLPLQIANHNHSETKDDDLKLENGTETKDSLSLTESPVTNDEMFPNRVNKKNEKNEPKHVTHIDSGQENFPKTIDEALS